MRPSLTPRRTVASLTFTGLSGALLAVFPAVPASAATALEGEAMTFSSSAVVAYSDGAASGGQAAVLRSNASLTAAMSTGASTHIVVRARGDQCKGAPRMVLTVNGVQLSSTSVSATSWTEYSAAVALSTGTHSVAIAYTNDGRTRHCDRNLRVDSIRTVEPVTSEPTVAPTPGRTNVLAGATLYVDPNSQAAKAAAALASTDPYKAAHVDKIAKQPQADWVGDWISTSNLAAHVDRRVSAATSAGAVPVLVTYAIPVRDCGSYSAGGIGTPEGYKAWVREMARGLAGRKAAVVLEPDALAGITCLSTGMQQTRLELLADAVQVLSAAGGQVYIDAGHSKWQSAATMATRLTSAGVAGARGFSLNVSNFHFTDGEVAYGKDLAQRLGGKSFVVDVSRNGLGPATGTEAWCNPAGRALGARPTVSTGVTGLDALLWIKRPGESDGACNGGPSSGTWWTDYAVGLSERTAH